MTMNDLLKSVRATGVLGVVGVFVPEDPKGPDKLAKAQSRLTSASSGARG